MKNSGTDGSGTDGSGTDGSGTDGSGTDGSGTGQTFGPVSGAGPGRPSRPGRAATTNPANRYERVVLEGDWEHLEDDEREGGVGGRKVATEFFIDESRSLIRENHSPDLPFRFSMNPYRGCEHGCAYCYARPGHETLGLGAGLDFETKIFLKPQAPRLLRQELNRPGWTGSPIAISGVTDCYQPVERRVQITRGCLRVLCEAQQAFTIVTKNALVVRDIDLLAEAAGKRLVQVNISMTTMDGQLGRRLEPRTSTPQARLRAIRELSQAGIPVGVMVSPVIPALTDHEIPAILAAAKEAGAQVAYSTLLRLPLTVLPIFMEWLELNCPDSRVRVESRIRECRRGELNDARFGHRMSGSGPYATHLQRTFRAFRDRLRLNREPFLDETLFRPPRDAAGQGRLF